MNKTKYIQIVQVICLCSLIFELIFVIEKEKTLHNNDL